MSSRKPCSGIVTEVMVLLIAASTIQASPMNTTNEDDIGNTATDTTNTIKNEGLLMMKEMVLEMPVKAAAYQINTDSLIAVLQNKVRFMLWLL
ncbi:unnamed protein product [Thelazia callipaeda]|uniref:Secreted protein n=1 Tax=Thelazia callipaeda TaxID=103827 RepID=A0A0N5CZJ1_THECL|nr:unnamed protein product [Thelazia callipaeda]